jgi:hypothetical protein
MNSSIFIVCGLPCFQTSGSFHPEMTVKNVLAEAVHGEPEEVVEGPVQQGGGTQGQLESLHLQEVGAADPLEHLAGELQQQLHHLPGP